MKFCPSSSAINDFVDDQLFVSKNIMPNGTKIFRNKNLGYRLWKEEYVKNIFVEPSGNE